MPDVFLTNPITFVTEPSSATRIESGLAKTSLSSSVLFTTPELARAKKQSILKVF